jgi:putative DNA-invertase from lambdoid prophage Rac
MKVGIYSRVSTNDQKTLPMQINAIKAYVKSRSWTITLEVQEISSGAKKLPKRELIMSAAKRRDIDVVIVWKLDRWGRSVTDLFTSLNELTAVGVSFISITEAIDLTTPIGRAMTGMLTIFADFERELLRERVKAGIAHSIEQGKPHGRPKTASNKTDEIISLFNQGKSKSEIARILDIGRTSVRRILQGSEVSGE